MSETKFYTHTKSHLPSHSYVGFEVLGAAVMKSLLYWDLTPCSPSKVDQCFKGIALFSACFVFGSLFDSEYEGGMFLGNVNWISTNDKDLL
jgi:hypothetical protein